MRQASLRLHASVHGAVQGVGYRFFVVEAARALELTGWVRNRTDGSVEVLAEGPRPALEALLEELRVGPRGAEVTDVGLDWSPAIGEHHGFSLRRI